MKLRDFVYNSLPKKSRKSSRKWSEDHVSSQAGGAWYEPVQHNPFLVSEDFQYSDCTSDPNGNTTSIDDIVDADSPTEVEDINFNEFPRCRTRIKTNPWLPSPKTSPLQSGSTSPITSSVESVDSPEFLHSLADDALSPLSSCSDSVFSDISQGYEYNTEVPLDVSHKASSQGYEYNTEMEMSWQSDQFENTDVAVKQQKLISNCIKTTDSDDEKKTHDEDCVVRGSSAPSQTQDAVVCLSQYRDDPEGHQDISVHSQSNGPYDSWLNVKSQTNSPDDSWLSGQSQNNSPHDSWPSVQSQSNGPDDSWLENINNSSMESQYSYEQCFEENLENSSQEMFHSHDNTFEYDGPCNVHDSGCFSYIERTDLGDEDRVNVAVTEPHDSQEDEGTVDSTVTATPSQSIGVEPSQSVTDNTQIEVYKTTQSKQQNDSAVPLQPTGCSIQDVQNAEKFIESVHNEPSSVASKIRSSLREQICKLREDKSTVDGLVMKAREEQRLGQIELRRLRTQTTLARKEILLKTLSELRGKLDEQTDRLQSAYNHIIQLQCQQLLSSKCEAA